LFYLPMLRRLVDLQQFEELKHSALDTHLETLNPKLLPLIALAHLQLGDYKAAMDFVQQTKAALGQLDDEAKVDLAGVYALMHRVDEAKALLVAAMIVLPSHPLALARLAWCEMQRGNMARARSLYQASADLAPQRLPVWIALVRLSIEAQQAAASQVALDQLFQQFETLRDEMPATAVDAFVVQLRCLQIEIWALGDNKSQIESWLADSKVSIVEDDWVGLVRFYASLLASKNQHADAEQALRHALKDVPKNIPLLSQLAELAQMQGRTQQVIALLLRCIHLNEQVQKSTVSFWIKLSSTCLHGMEAQARKSAEKAVELVAELTVTDELTEQSIKLQTWQARNALAQVESQAQNFTEAEALFNQILEENPYFINSLQGLGSQKMQQGDIDGAIALFERIKQIDPVSGFSSLINARQFPDDVKTLERMEKVATQPSVEGKSRTGILFQLASAWEKRKDFDKAFELASLANETSKAVINYDPKDHRQKSARIRYAFSKSLFEHRAEHGCDSSLPVFVLGMPRSGTTLVEQILASHSQIFGAGELGVIPSAIAGLDRWERQTGSGRRYPDCVDDLSAYTSKGIAENILKELQEYDPEARHVVDKLPHNFENIGLIKFLFPNAKIISVRRDPRDIALSNCFTDYQAKHGGMGFAYDLEWIGEQLADHNLMIHHWHQVFPSEILEINYEDVVENTETISRQMLDYIGVEWEPQVLAFNELDRPVKTASVWQVRQPIYKTSTAKWKRYQDHLAPLMKGTNAKISWEPIEMLSLPAPAMLTDAVAYYKADQLDEAEGGFKKLLHHIPEHAAANFMLGLVYAQKGHLKDAIEHMEKGHQKCPWNKLWRQDLIQAYEMHGDLEKAELLKAKGPKKADVALLGSADCLDPDYLPEDYF
jgi:tetratricopeptide (TPR) repeat protein